MDDCYITYRYAFNIFHHKQFVYNLGERVLGTTAPLYALLLAGMQIFSENIPLMSNFISCLSAALAGFFLYLVLKKDNLPLGIFCALSCPFILQDIGLETNFLFCLFALSAYLCAQGRYLCCSAALGLCFLTRHDSAIFVLSMLIIYVLKMKKLPRKECIVFSAIVLPWFVFSFFYFDSPLPTSLQAKQGYTNCGHYLVHAFWHLACYCDRYNFYLFSWLSQALASFLPAGAAGAGNGAGTFLAAIYMLLTMLFLLYYLKNIAKHHYTGALFYLYPLLMIIALSAIAPPPEHHWHLSSAVNFALLGQLHFLTAPLHAIIKKPFPTRPRSAVPFACLTALISAYLLFFIAMNVRDFAATARHADQSPWFGARYHNYKQIGFFLRDTISDEETVFILEVGTAGYYSMKRMIDGAGLVAPGYGQYHRQGCWLLGMEKGFPDYIVAWDIDIPYYEPVYHVQNSFGTLLVYKKSKNLPEHDYPFFELNRSWEKWKESQAPAAGAKQNKKLR